MKFVIYSPPYDENSGGSIAIHSLCHTLNSLGHNALLYPFMFKDLVAENDSLWVRLKIFLKFVLLKRHFFLSDMNTPVASKSDILDSVVIYPEIVRGNPLNASRVVRWLLYKPGGINGFKDFGENDLFFCYQPQFNDASINKGEVFILRTIRVMHDVYFDRGLTERNGVCYVVRKGKDRVDSADVSDGVVVDGLSHTETAAIFNNSKYCISFDPYTMYSTYAAMCGCISIVVPIDGVSKEEWRPREESRYGIAYGEEDVDRAIRTRSLLFRHLEGIEKSSVDTVKDFVKICADKFDMGQN